VLKRCVVPDNTDLKCARERIELEISNAHRMADPFFCLLMLSLAEPCPCTFMLVALLMLFFGTVLGVWQQYK